MSETELPSWRRAFVEMLARAPDAHLDQVQAAAELGLVWRRSQRGSPPDQEWPAAVRAMVRANEDRLADVILERARRGDTR